MEVFCTNSTSNSAFSLIHAWYFSNTQKKINYLMFKNNAGLLGYISLIMNPLSFKSSKHAVKRNWVVRIVLTEKYISTSMDCKKYPLCPQRWEWDWTPALPKIDDRDSFLFYSSQNSSYKGTESLPFIVLENFWYKNRGQGGYANVSLK